MAFLHGEAASSAIENAGCAYQSPSVIASGADARGVALLSTLTNLVLSILLIKVPSLVEGRHSLLKRTTILVATTAAITWIPIVAVMLFFKSVNPLFLTALWVISLVPTTMLFPLRDSWLAGLVPPEKMGRYLSWRSVIAGASYLGTFLLMGYVLDMAMGHGDSAVNTVAANPILARGYAFVLAVAFLASAISVVLYFKVRPPPAPKMDAVKPSLGFIAFLRDARKSHLGTFILFVSVYTFAVNMAGPLFASYMLDELNFSMMTFTSILAVEYVARIISLTFWGRMVDKSGSLKVLNNVTYVIPFVPLLWMFSANFFYLSAVQMLSGVVWAAFDLCVQTFIYKATPADQRLRYIVYHRSLTSFSVAVGALTGGFLLNHVFRIFGSQILSLFLISGVLRMVVARVMLPRLTAKGIPDAVIHPELALELAAVPPNSREGLYYHPELWRRFARRAASVSGEILGRAVGNAQPPRNGLLYHPWRWAQFLKAMGKQPAPFRVYSPPPSHNGLFYKPAEWKEYLRRTGLQPAMADAGRPAGPEHAGLFSHPEQWAYFQAKAAGHSVDAVKPVSRMGLFHNPQGWRDYLRQSMALNAATAHAGGEGVVLRQPVFYHPEMWEAYKRETAPSAARARQRVPAARKALLYHGHDWSESGDPPKTARKNGRAVPARESLIRRPEAWDTYRAPNTRSARRPAPAVAAASGAVQPRFHRTMSGPARGTPKSPPSATRALRFPRIAPALA